MKSKSKSLPRIDERQSLLRQSRNLKMAGSAHAYVRGNTLKFYEWLNAADSTLPQGPPIWICGDCHVGNLGPIANSDDEIGIEIRLHCGRPAGNDLELHRRLRTKLAKLLHEAHQIHAAVAQRHPLPGGAADAATAGPCARKARPSVPVRASPWKCKPCRKRAGKVC